MMIALSVYPPGCKPRAPERYGLISIDQALVLAQQFTKQQLVCDVYEYTHGKPVLVRHLEPEKKS